MAFQDKILVCQDCGKEFTWTASEQEFYAQKGFQNAPKRCPDCRRKKKENFGHRGGGQRMRQSYEITCANCGKTDTVPFEPKGDRPVLCSDCFQKQKQGQLAS